MIKTICKKKKWKKSRWLSEEALQIVKKRREVKGKKKKKKKKEKERYTQLNAEFQRKGKTDKKTFLNDQLKEIEENDTRGRN